jgi:hypothetical protein
MKKHLKTKAELNLESENLQKEIQPTLHKYNLKKNLIPIQTIDDLNAKILKITLKIQDQYPELYKYLEEMPVTIPDEKNPKITRYNLKKYYESLNASLSKYVLEHPNQ